MSFPRCAVVWLTVKPALFAFGLGQLPPVDAELSGNLTPFGVRENLRLNWTLATETVEHGNRRAGFSLKGEGLALSGKADLLARSGAGQWNLEEARLELATWYQPFARRYAPESADLRVTGSATAHGSGSFVAEPFLAEGELHLSLLEVAAAAVDDSWHVRHLTGQVVLNDLMGVSSLPGQRLTFGEAGVADVALKNGLLELQVLSSSRVRITGFRVEAFGGWVRFEPFEIDARHPALNAVVHVEKIRIEELRRFLPETVTEAKGRLTGQLAVSWSPEAGLNFGKGSLRLEKNERALLRMVAAPGFLSSKLPTEFDLVPWLPPALVKRFLKLDTSNRRALVAIESGEEELLVESLEIDLHEPAESGQATAEIRLVARPARAEAQAAVKRLKLNVQVSGPLADVVRFGMDGRVSFGL